MENRVGLAPTMPGLITTVRIKSPFASLLAFHRFIKVEDQVGLAPTVDLRQRIKSPCLSLLR